MVKRILNTFNNIKKIVMSISYIVQVSFKYDKLYLMYFIPQLGVFQSLFGYGKYLCMLVLLMVFFLTVYMTVPNRKSKLRYEFWGAVFSTIAWLGFSWAFSFYINHYANYSVTYGSLATIVIFILWLSSGNL